MDGQVLASHFRREIFPQRTCNIDRAWTIRNTVKRKEARRVRSANDGFLSGNSKNRTIAQVRACEAGHLARAEPRHGEEAHSERLFEAEGHRASVGHQSGELLGGGIARNRHRVEANPADLGCR